MVCKKYSAQYKIEKVEEYLQMNEKGKITKAEFASRNDISDSTFNDWVLKYNRQKNGFCNITKEIEKLEDVKSKNEIALIEPKEENNPNRIKLTYNGITIEFSEVILDRVMRIVKTW